MVLARFSSLHFYKTCPEYDGGKSAANLRNLFRKYWLEALLLVLVLVVTVVLVMESSPAPGLGSQSFPRMLDCHGSKSKRRIMIEHNLVVDGGASARIE